MWKYAVGGINSTIKSTTTISYYSDNKSKLKELVAVTKTTVTL